MKATKITYSECINTGNYQHVNIGIEIELGEGDKASDALDKAKLFVQMTSPKNMDKERLRLAKLTVSDPSSPHVLFVQAEKTIAELEEKLKEELPF